MKNMKKVLALLVAVLMIAASFAALADDPAGRTGGQPLTDRTITLTNPSAGHTYTLYQIFTGTFKVIAGNDTLGDIAYGDGIKLTDGKYDGKTAAELANSIADSDAGARAFANSIDADLQNGTEKTAATANPESLVWNNLSEGYYIIKDTSTNLADSDEHDLVVVQVLDNVVITAKAGTVEFDKKVKDRNDSTQKPSVYDAWGNTSDYDVGDDVPYQVTIKLPANFSSYEKYTATVHDKMDAGLNLNDSSIEVYVGDSTEKLTSGYTLKKTELPDGETFEIVFADVKALEGVGDNVTITVYYTAKLTGANVVYGNPGNKNEAWLTYSNNPTTGQEGGTTPHKTTVTFTYKLEVDKTDGTNPLPGAEFAFQKLIMKEDGTTEWKTLQLVKNAAGTVFTFDGLDDGFYKISETVTPAGYNSIDDIYFAVVAGHTVTLDSLTVTQRGADLQELDTSAVTANFNVTLTKVEDGKDAGLIDTTVVNNQGSTLPSTGGIGTTIFYVGGSILVLAAVILLVTKRRMSAEK